MEVYIDYHLGILYSSVNDGVYYSQFDVTYLCDDMYFGGNNRRFEKNNGPLT